MPNWKKVILSGSNAVLAEITASRNLSGSGTATASYGLFTGSFGGDGSQLTNVPSTPFPFTGDALITGSLIVSQSYTVGDTDSTALRLIGSGSVSQSGIFEVEGSAGPLFSVADGLDGVLMEVNNISGLPLLQVSSSNEVFINRGNLTSGVTTATASFAYFTGSFAGDASGLTNVPAGSTPTLQQVITAGAQANGDVVITGSLVISGSFDAFKLETDNIILGPNANNIQAGADNSVIIGHANVQSAYSGDRNVIVGDNSAIALTSGDENVIIGAESGVQLQANSYNIAIGSNTLNNVRGSGNIALGFRSMQYHDGASGYTQTNNVAIGIYSLRYGRNNSNYNVALGAYSLTGTGNTANQYNIGIGSFAGTNITSGEYNILIGPGIASDLTTQDKQLRIGSGSITTISASLATGDVTFYNTASAPNFSGSFQGDGSQLTNLPAGSTPTLDAVTTQGNVTSNAITAGTISGSSFKLNNANALSHTGNVLYVGNSNDWTTVELGRETTDEIHVNGLLKAEQLLRAEQGAAITGSLEILSAASKPPVKIYNSGTNTLVGFGDNSTRFQIPSSGTATMVGFNMYSGILAGTLDGGSQVINKLDRLELGGYGFGGTSVIGMVRPAGTVTTAADGFAMYPDDANGAGTVSPHFKTEDGSILILATTSSLKRVTADSSKISGSGGLSVESSGSTVFNVIGSQGTLFSVDDDLDGTIFTANDRTGLPVLEASASGEVYIGKSPQSLYTTAVISSNNANVTQSIYGLDTSSYGGAFFEYTAHSGSNARAGNIMSVWNGSSLNFTETTTTDIGSTSDLVMKVHISESQAQLAAFSTNAGYNIKTIIKSI